MVDWWADGVQFNTTLGVTKRILYSQELKNSGDDVKVYVSPDSWTGTRVLEDQVTVCMGDGGLLSYLLGTTKSQK